MFAALKQAIATLRAPMTGAALELTLDSMSSLEVQQWLNDNSEAETYFNEGDYLMFIPSQDCITIVPRAEFEKEFTFDSPPVPGQFTPCTGTPGFFNPHK